MKFVTEARQEKKRGSSQWSVTVCDKESDCEELCHEPPPQVFD